MGVEKETGFYLKLSSSTGKSIPEHFFLQDITKPVDFGEGKKNMYPYADTEILIARPGSADGLRILEKGAAFTSAVCHTALKTAGILYRSIASTPA